MYAFIDKMQKDTGSIDILVNNAGTILRKPDVEHSDEYWDKVIEVNIKAQFIISCEIGKEMLWGRRGKIVFIASLLSYQGGITVPGYAASKGSIKNLVMALAKEWAFMGVNVNVVAPGYIKTDNTEALCIEAARNIAILEHIPMGRWGKAEDVAGIVLFFSNPASDYMSGAIVPVNGGWMGR